MTTVAARFVGCKVSQADGEEALAGLVAAGLEPASSTDAADVVVVHTCCVTAEAERKSRRTVRCAASGGKRVVVAGCAATLHPEQFAGEGVTVAARPDWAAIAEQLHEQSARAVAAGLDEAHVGVGGMAAPHDAKDGANDGAEDGANDGAEDGASPRAMTPGHAAAGQRPSRAAATSGSPSTTRCAETRGDTGAPRATPGARTRLVLKVQDGCAGVCAYCVVRLVRGRPRSVPLAEALAAARAGIEGGCGEVVLSGIDLGAWRDGELRLPELVAAVAELDGLRRVRVSSLEPGHVTPALLKLLAHPRVARHLHVPLQSADDSVLRHMRRPYTWEGYLAAAHDLRGVAGESMLSTDVIVGYPTEDEAAFRRTLAALESGLFGRAHVFAYSARPGTAAAELPPLPAAVVKERMGRALAAAEAAAQAARRAALGRYAEVLVEERRDGLWRGYSSGYIRYALRGSARRGELVTAVAEELVGDGVAGTVKE